MCQQRWVSKHSPFIQHTHVCAVFPYVCVRRCVCVCVHVFVWQRERRPNESVSVERTILSHVQFRFFLCMPLLPIRISYANVCGNRIACVWVYNDVESRTMSPSSSLALFTITKKKTRNHEAIVVYREGRERCTARMSSSRILTYWKLK